MLKYSSEPNPALPSEWDSLLTCLKALADSNRLRIFNLFMEGTQCNCELGEQLGLPPNLISHHLAVLRQAGLVEARRDVVDSRWIYYSVNRAMLEKFAAALQTLLDPNRIQPRQPRCGRQPQSETPAQQSVEVN